MTEPETKPAGAAPAEEGKVPEAEKSETATETPAATEAAVAPVPAPVTEAPTTTEAAPEAAATAPAAPEEPKAAVPTTEPPKDEPKTESKAEETKAEETKAEETKAEETKAEETKAEETKAEETKAEETKTEEPKKEVKKEVKVDAPPPKPTPISELWDAARAHGHPEIWGVTLADPEDHVPTRIVLQKYLNANDGDLAKAKDQMIKTLDWRRETKPLELLKKAYSKNKFEGLGFVTSYSTEGATPADPESKETFTWNLYGSTKSMDETFGNLEEFMEWRVALMELALQELSIATAGKGINADYDPYKIYQVHDYKSISFLRAPPKVKSASSETIKVFAQNYPELLKEKFFVNVPAIMGFMYTFIKLFVAPKTIKKFHPMANGGNLALEFRESKVKSLAEELPTEYGGKGGDLKTQGTEPLLE